jgi:hypothetical protein
MVKKMTHAYNRAYSAGTPLSTGLTWDNVVDMAMSPDGTSFYVLSYYSYYSGQWYYATSISRWNTLTGQSMNSIGWTYANYGPTQLEIGEDGNVYVGQSYGASIFVKKFTENLVGDPNNVYCGTISFGSKFAVGSNGFITSAYASTTELIAFGEGGSTTTIGTSASSWAVLNITWIGKGPGSGERYAVTAMDYADSKFYVKVIEWNGTNGFNLISTVEMTPGISDYSTFIKASGSNIIIGNSQNFARVDTATGETIDFTSVDNSNYGHLMEANGDMYYFCIPNSNLTKYTPSGWAKPNPTLSVSANGTTASATVTVATGDAPIKRIFATWKNVATGLDEASDLSTDIVDGKIYTHIFTSGIYTVKFKVVNAQGDAHTEVSSSFAVDYTPPANISADVAVGDADFTSSYTVDVPITGSALQRLKYCRDNNEDFVLGFYIPVANEASSKLSNVYFYSGMYGLKIGSTIVANFYDIDKGMSGSVTPTWINKDDLPTAGSTTNSSTDIGFSYQGNSLVFRAIAVIRGEDLTFSEGNPTAYLSIGIFEYSPIPLKIIAYSAPASSFTSLSDYDLFARIGMGPLLATQVYPFNVFNRSISTTVYFRSKDSNSTITSAVINWGDGTSNVNLTTGVQSATHTYDPTSNATSFDVTITITDSLGRTAVLTKTLSVLPVPSLTVNNVAVDGTHYAYGTYVAFANNSGNYMAVVYTIDGTDPFTSGTTNWGSESSTFLELQAQTRVRAFTTPMGGDYIASKSSDTTVYINIAPSPTITVQSAIANQVLLRFSHGDPDNAIASADISFGDETGSPYYTSLTAGQITTLNSQGYIDIAHTYPGSGRWYPNIYIYDVMGSSGSCGGDTGDLLHPKACVLTWNRRILPIHTNMSGYVSDISISEAANKVYILRSDDTQNGPGSYTIEIHVYNLTTGGLVSQTIIPPSAGYGNAIGINVSNNDSKIYISCSNGVLSLDLNASAGSISFSAMTYTNLGYLVGKPLISSTGEKAILRSEYQAHWDYRWGYDGYSANTGLVLEGSTPVNVLQNIPLTSYEEGVIMGAVVLPNNKIFMWGAYFSYGNWYSQYVQTWLYSYTTFSSPLTLISHKSICTLDHSWFPGYGYYCGANVVAIELIGSPHTYPPYKRVMRIDSSNHSFIDYQFPFDQGGTLDNGELTSSACRSANDGNIYVIADQSPSRYSLEVFNSPPIVPPTVNATVQSGYNGSATLPIVIKTTVDNSTTLASILITWHDGTTTNITDSQSLSDSQTLSGLVVSRTYTTPGFYAPTILVTDALDATATTNVARTAVNYTPETNIASDRSGGTFTISSSLTVTLNADSIKKIKYCRDNQIPVYFGLQLDTETGADNFKVFDTQNIASVLLRINGGSSTAQTIDLDPSASFGIKYARCWDGGVTSSVGYTQAPQIGVHSSYVYRLLLAYNVPENWNSIASAELYFQYQIIGVAGSRTGRVTIFASDDLTSESDTNLYYKLGLESAPTDDTKSNVTGTIQTGLSTVTRSTSSHQTVSISLDANGLQKINYCRQNNLPFWIGLRLSGTYEQNKYLNSSTGVTEFARMTSDDPANLNINNEEVNMTPNAYWYASGEYPSGSYAKTSDSYVSLVGVVHIDPSPDTIYRYIIGFSSASNTKLALSAKLEFLLASRYGDTTSDLVATVFDENSPATLSGINLFSEIGGDIAAPSITPISGNANKPVTVTITAATGSVPDGIYYTTNGDDPTDSSTAYTAPFEISSGASVTIKARAYKSGVGSLITTSVLSLNTPPTATLTEGTHDDLTLNVSVNATDSDGTISYSIINWGDGNTTANPTFNTPISHTYSTRGSKTVSFMARDNSGSETTDTKSIAVSAKPVTTIVSHTITGRVLDINVKAVDPDGGTITGIAIVWSGSYTQNIAYADLTSGQKTALASNDGLPLQFTYNATDYPAGFTGNVLARSTDSDENTSSDASLSVVIENLAPTVTFSSGVNIHSDHLSLDFDVSIEDPDNIGWSPTTWWYYPNWGDITTFPIDEDVPEGITKVAVTGSLTAEVDYSSLGHGTYNLVVEVKDNADVITRISHSCALTNVAPTISSATTSRDGNIFEVEVAGSDEDGAVAKISYDLLNNGTWVETDVNGSSPWTVELPIDPEVPATYNVHVKAIDNDGAASSSTLATPSIVIHLLPTCVINSVSKTMRTVSIDISAESTDGDVDHIDIEWDTNVIETIPFSSLTLLQKSDLLSTGTIFTHLYSADDYPSGVTPTIKVNITSEYSATSIDETTSIAVTNTDPTLSLEEISIDHLLYTVKVTASDPDDNTWTVSNAGWKIYPDWGSIITNPITGSVPNGIAVINTGGTDESTVNYGVGGVGVGHGTYNLVVEVCDGSEVPVRATIQVVLPNTAPVVSSVIVDPATSNDVYEADIIVAATDSDGTIAKIAIDPEGDGNWSEYVVTGESPYSIPHTFSTLGVHKPKAKAKDNDAAWSEVVESALGISINATPTCSILSSSSEGRVASIVVRAADTDGSISSLIIDWDTGTTYTHVIAPNQRAALAGDGLTFSFTYTKSNYPTGGTFDISVTSVDNVGANSTPATDQVEIIPTDARLVITSCVPQADHKSLLVTIAGYDEDNTLFTPSFWNFIPKWGEIGDINPLLTVPSNLTRVQVIGSMTNTFDFESQAIGLGHGRYNVVVEATSPTGDTLRAIATNVDLLNVAPSNTITVIERPDSYSITIDLTAQDSDGTIVDAWIDWDLDDEESALTEMTNEDIDNLNLGQTLTESHTYYIESPTTFTIKFFTEDDNGDIGSTEVEVIIMGEFVVNKDWTGTDIGDPVTIEEKSYVFGSNAFDNIQDAIDAIDINATEMAYIKVFSGTYDQNLVIDKKVTIYGPNTDVNGNGTRVAEAYVIPGAVDMPALIEIKHDNVVLDGLNINGNNPDNESIRTVNNIEVSVNNCIKCVDDDGEYGIGGTVIKNCIIKNSFDDIITLTGKNDSLDYENYSIYNNLISNTNDVAIKLSSNCYASIYSNTISKCITGIDVSNFNGTRTTVSNTPCLVNDNTITECERGIFHSECKGIDTPPRWSFLRNTIESTKSGMVFNELNLGYSPLSIVGNILTGEGSIGFGGYEIIACNNITISGGTVNNFDYGLWVFNEIDNIDASSVSLVNASSIIFTDCLNGTVFADDSSSTAPSISLYISSLASSGTALIGTSGLRVRGTDAFINYFGVGSPLVLTGKIKNCVVLMSNGTDSPDDFDVTEINFFGKYVTEMNEIEYRSFQMRSVDKNDNPALSGFITPIRTFNSPVISNERYLVDGDIADSFYGELIDYKNCQFIVGLTAVEDFYSALDLCEGNSYDSNIIEMTPDIYELDGSIELSGKNLIINGPNENVPTTSARSLEADFVGDPALSDIESPIFTILNGQENLELNGLQFSSCRPFYTDEDFNVEDSYYINIKNCKISEGRIMDSPVRNIEVSNCTLNSSSTTNESAIEIFSEGISKEVRIIGNLINISDGGGIHVDNNPSSVLISSNIVTNVAENSIKITLCENVTITSNILTNSFMDSILVDESSIVRVISNKIYDNARSCVDGSSAIKISDCNGEILVDRNIVEISFVGIGEAGNYHGIIIKGGDVDLTIKRNTLRGGSPSPSMGAPESSGILIISTDGVNTLIGLITVNNNNISYFVNGLAIYNEDTEAYGGLDLDALTLAITGNTLKNNISFGAINGIIGDSLNMNRNSWGDPTGPYHPTLNSSGKGNAVSDNIEFAFWSDSGKSVVINDTWLGIENGTTVTNNKIQYVFESTAFATIQSAINVSPLYEIGILRILKEIPSEDIVIDRDIVIVSPSIELSEGSFITGRTVAITLLLDAGNANVFFTPKSIKISDLEITLNNALDIKKGDTFYGGSIINSEITLQGPPINDDNSSLLFAFFDYQDNGTVEARIFVKLTNII